MGRGFAALLLLLLLPFGYAITEDQALPILAANMQNLSQGDYALDCGPTVVNDNVLNVVDGNLRSHYCVLKDDQLIFGTFKISAGGPIENYGALAEPILRAYASYSPHVKQEDMPDLTLACPTGEIGSFWECATIDSVYGKLHPYLYVDDIENTAQGRVAYLLVSDEPIGPLERSFFRNFWGFFLRLFGSQQTETQFTAANPQYNEFHHAYFAKQNTHQVIATWKQSTATIIYQGFGYDFSVTYPRRELGSNGQQRITLSNFARTVPANVQQWRKMTSGLRIGEAVDEDDWIGSRCGDGIIDGFTEQCEGTNYDGQTCISQGFGTGSIRCHAPGTPNECKYDLSPCSCQNADGDGYNVTGATCGTIFDCNDTLEPILVNGTPVYRLHSSVPMTGFDIHPGAIDYCGNNVSESCALVNNTYLGADGPNCVQPPPPPLTCNFDNVCADDERSSGCRDCEESEDACPTAVDWFITQGQYTISTRANANNSPELVIETKNVTCSMLGSYTVIKNATPGTHVLFQDGNRMVLLITGAFNWTITGNETGENTGNTQLKKCWATQQPNGRDLKLNITINDVPSCAPAEAGCVRFGQACGFASDCCSYSTIETWCGEQNTCERDFTPRCEVTEGLGCGPEIRRLE